MSDSVLDLRAVEARLEKSLKEVYRLCQVGTRWEMHVPVDEESDSDVVLAAGLIDAKALLVHCRALRAALLDAQEWAAGYPLGGGTDTIAARQVYDRAAAVLGAAVDTEP